MNGMMSQWWRIGGICGIIFLILFIVGGVVIQGEPPSYDDPISEIRTYWEDESESYLIGDYLLGLGTLVFLLPFLVCLRALLGRAEGEPQIWSRVGFAGGLLLIAIAAVASGSWTALAFAADKLDDESLLALMYLDVGAWHGFSFAIGVLILASSLVMAMTGALWRWLGYIGIIVGIAALIAPLGILDEDTEDIFDTIGFIPFIGSAVWALLTSIGMLMKKEEPAMVVRPQI